MEDERPLDEAAFQALVSKLVVSLELSHKTAIADLVLSWALADMQLVGLQMKVQGIDLPELARTSLNDNLKGRLKAIRKGLIGYGYEYNDSVIRSYDKWISEYEHFARPRHIVCHAGLFGYVKDEPDCMVFGRLSKQSTGAQVVYLRVADLHQSTLFASILANGIRGQLDQIIAAGNSD